MSFREYKHRLHKIRDTLLCLDNQKNQSYL